MGRECPLVALEGTTAADHHSCQQFVLFIVSVFSIIHELIHTRKAVEMYNPFPEKFFFKCNKINNPD